MNLEQRLNLNSQLPNAILAQILPIEPGAWHKFIHRVPVNGSSMILNLEQGWTLNGQLSTAISAAVLPIEPQDHAGPFTGTL